MSPFKEAPALIEEGNHAGCLEETFFFREIIVCTWKGGMEGSCLLSTIGRPWKLCAGKNAKGKKRYATFA